MRGGEEGGEEGVFGAGIGDEGEVEVVEGDLEVACCFGFAG